MGTQIGRAAESMHGERSCKLPVLKSVSDGDVRIDIAGHDAALYVSKTMTSNSWEGKAEGKQEDREFLYHWKTRLRLGQHTVIARRGMHVWN